MQNYCYVFDFFIISIFPYNMIGSAKGSVYLNKFIFDELISSIIQKKYIKFTI